MRKIKEYLKIFNIAVDKINEMCKILNRWKRKRENLKLKIEICKQSQKVVVMVYPEWWFSRPPNQGQRFGNNIHHSF